MRPSLTIVAIVLLLPSVCPALFDEPSVRKVKLEDIEEEHLQHERHSKTIDQSPPPLSKQPAKGQPIKMYTPLTVDAATEYNKQTPSISHHQYTTAKVKHHHQHRHHQHQRVQPLTDQSTATEADYQQAPAYQSETIVYLPSSARGQANADQHQTDSEDQQQQQQQPSQPSPIFYYSHDSRQQPSGGSGYQVQFVPISQHSGSDEQQQQEQQQQSSYRGPPVTVPSADASASVVSYSHISTASLQPTQTVQYVTGNGVREPSEVQHVYSLFDSDKDIEYSKPTSTYGSPFSKQHKIVGYKSQQTKPRPSHTYRPDEQPRPVFSLQKDIEYAQREVEESDRKPAITYGPPSGVGETPQIQYGDPDAPFRRPSSQSNQNAYAPRRPESSPQTEEKPFAVSFPYPPSFVSITTARPYYEKTEPISEPPYNEVSQWQAPHVMPLHLIPPQDSEYRSYSNVQPIQGPTPAPPTIQTQTAPLIDFFHSRRAKSLLDSYIPSWLIACMQEEHARHLQQNYVLPPQSKPQPETGYNTIAYSTHFENIYPKNFKRSIKRSLQAKTA